jgi:hypothetical protein
MSPALLAAGIDPTMQAFARGLVQCAIAPGATVLGCARKSLVGTLPEQARPFAGCLLEGGTADDCARRAVIGALPPEARGLAECIALAAAPARCAANRALSETQRRAFETVGKLDSDPRGTLRNTIKVAEGIRDDDWAKVISFGGEEAAKLAAKILYKALFPPLIPLAPLLDPAIDATISNNAGRVRDFIDAARRGDEAGAAKAATALAMNILTGVPGACAAIPSFELKDRICDELHELIDDFAGNVGEGVGQLFSGNVGEGARRLTCAPVQAYLSP